MKSAERLSLRLPIGISFRQPNNHWPKYKFFGFFSACCFGYGLTWFRHILWEHTLLLDRNFVVSQPTASARVEWIWNGWRRWNAFRLREVIFDFFRNHRESHYFNLKAMKIFSIASYREVDLWFRSAFLISSNLHNYGRQDKNHSSTGENISPPKTFTPSRCVQTKLIWDFKCFYRI